MTPDEMLDRYEPFYWDNLTMYDRKDIIAEMKKYAEQEVENALEAALTNGKIIYSSNITPYIDEDSIRNAYKIKS